MSMSNLLDLATTIMVALIPVLTGYLISIIKHNKVASVLASVLPVFARDAVLTVQALGVDNYISGALKRSLAAKAVSETLSALKINHADYDAIIRAVQAAYTECVQSGLFDQYPQKAEPVKADEAKTAEPDAAAKQDETVPASSQVTAPAAPVTTQANQNN